MTPRSINESKLFGVAEFTIWVEDGDDCGWLVVFKTPMGAKHVIYLPHKTLDIEDIDLT